MPAGLAGWRCHSTDSERAMMDGVDIEPKRQQATARRSVSREGLIAGLLGAGAVAVWFLVVDIARGRPLLVPSALGHILFHATGTAGTEGRAAHVIAYSVFHVAAFVVVGILAAAILRRSERQPSLLAGAIILFVVFEAGFYVITSLLAQSQTLGLPSWYMVVAGNLIASVVMGMYLWRSYPTAARDIDAALSGRA